MQNKKKTFESLNLINKLQNKICNVNLKLIIKKYFSKVDDWKIIFDQEYFTREINGKHSFVDTSENTQLI